MPGIIHFQFIKSTEPVSTLAWFRLQGTVAAHRCKGAQPMLTIRFCRGLGNKSEWVILQENEVIPGPTVSDTHLKAPQHCLQRGCRACQLDRAYLPPVLALDCKATSSNAACAAHAQSSKPHSYCQRSPQREIKLLRASCSTRRCAR